MSAFIVDREHIDRIVQTAHCWHVRADSSDDPTDIGRMLWVENCKSVSYRYDEPAETISEAMDYRYRHNPFSGPMTPVQAIKAVQCLRYQSCEHREWADTEASRFLTYLEAEAIHRLPGYDDAPWEWTDAMRPVDPRATRSHDPR